MMQTLYKNLNVSKFAELRIQTWLKHYPNCIADLEQVFGVPYPTVKQVSEWKAKWYLTTPYQMAIYDDNSIVNSDRKFTRKKIEDMTVQLGIHPYFWDFCVKCAALPADHQKSIPPLITSCPTVSFYKEEHLVLFKLGWNQ